MFFYNFSELPAKINEFCSIAPTKIFKAAYLKIGLSEC